MRDRFRIASFNAENLAHPGVFFFMREDDAPYTDELFAEKSHWVAQILDDGRADIVGFQEVFSLEGLKRSIAQSSYLGRFPDVAVRAPGCEIDLETGKPRNVRKDAKGRDAVEGPHCGLVSRFPVLDCVAISDFPAEVNLLIPTGLHDDDGKVVTLHINRFERAVIRATIQLPDGHQLIVFVTHLKSKRPKFLTTESKEDRRRPIVGALGNIRSLIVRAVESVALRALVLREIDDPVDGERGKAVVVLGDLNDDTASVTTEVIAGPRPPFYLSTASKLPIWDIGLTSVHDIIAQRSMRDVAYTHIFDGKYSILDHILISQELTSGFPKRIARLLNVVVHNDHVVDENLAMPERPETIVVDGVKLKAPGTRSDHGVPVAEFEFEVEVPT
jgi:hypothetical protein